MLTRNKSHLVAIRLRVDKPITQAQARYAVWNAIHDMDIYGAGDLLEPWGTGRIRVPRRPPAGPRQSAKGRDRQ
jgi:hypothetical protein